MCLLQDGTKHFVYLSPSMSKTFVSPVWCVKVVHQLAEANMTLVRDLTTNELQINKTPELPVLRNMKDIALGEQLVLYRPSVSEPLEIEPLSDVKRRVTVKGPEA